MYVKLYKKDKDIIGYLLDRYGTFGDMDRRVKLVGKIN